MYLGRDDMKNLLIVSILLLIVTIMSGCGKAPESVVAKANVTIFTVSTSDLCIRLNTWKQGTSNQLIAPPEIGMVFYDTGIYLLDTQEKITDGHFDFGSCEITISNGVVSVDPIVWSGW